MTKVEWNFSESLRAGFSSTNPDGLLDTESMFEALRTVELPDDVALSLEYLINSDNPQPGMLKSLALAEAELS